MKLKKYIMAIGVVSMLALSIAACAKKADTAGTGQDSKATESSDAKATSQEVTIAYDESVKQLELNFDGLANLIGVPYEEIISYKQEPKDDQKTAEKRVLKYEDPAIEFVLYPDPEDPLNEEGYLTQAIKTDMKTAWGLDEDKPVKDLVVAVSATSEPIYTEVQAEGDLAIGNAGQKIVEFESYGYLFRVAYDGDKVTPDSQVGVYSFELVDSLKKK